MGDFARPLQISKFVKDVHAGFQLLNLKNDVLRRRSDGMKYAVCGDEPVLVFAFAFFFVVSSNHEKVAESRFTNR